MCKLLEETERVWCWVLLLLSTDHHNHSQKTSLLFLFMTDLNTSTLFLHSFFIFVLFVPPHCHLFSVHVGRGFGLFLLQVLGRLMCIYTSILHRSCQAWVICRILSIKVIFLLFILHRATVTTPYRLWYWKWLAED